MTQRRLTVDAGIVAALGLATYLTSRPLFIANPKLLIKYGEAAWHAGLARWWVATVLGMAALLLRRRFPLVALAATGGMALAHVTSERPGVTPLDAAAPIALYTVANAPLRRVFSYAALAASVSCALLPQLLDLPPIYFGPWRDASLLLPVAMAVAWLVGDRARTRRLYLEQVTARARDLERDRDRQAELAAAAERARIARDLHDAVAHGLSIVVIQAQAAAGAMEKRPATARAALAAIVATGRDSLAEMRRLLGLTRPQSPELAPLPGLGDLPGLAERVRAAGLPVSLRVDGDDLGVSPGVGLCAYRIVQEALTNALKYAGPHATVDVTLHCGANKVELAVHDTGRGAGGEPDELRGNGLRGMRERVAMLGGTVAAGDAPDGGFQVCAELPLTDKPAEPV
ncbi:MAG TPA: histidine kinase [Rugosimonospora sp.]|nr:histidine kinase [Rugosimonospora sp.]